MKRIAIPIIIFVCSCIPAFGQANAADANAQSTAALEQHVRELEDRVIALEGKLRSMQSTQSAQVPEPQPAQPAQPATAAQSGVQAPPQTTMPVALSPNEAEPGIGGTTTQLPIYGGNTGASKALNPDISVIGDF